MGRYEDFLNFYQIEVYLNGSIQNQNNYLLLELDKGTSGHFHREINLVNLYTILKSKNKFFIAYMYLLENKSLYEQQATAQHKFFNLFLLENKFNQKTFEEHNDSNFWDLFLIKYQKDIFKVFKEYIIITQKMIDGYTFSPECKRLINSNGLIYLNDFIPKNRFDGLVPNLNSNFPHIEKLLRNILQEGYEHFLKFLAWKLQNPTKFIATHFIIYDNGGTGKTEILTEDVLDKLFNLVIVSQNELISAFNGFLVNKTMAVCEEIEGYEDEKKMKVLTGAKRISIRDLYKSAYMIDNYVNYIVYTNELKTIKMSEYDRRYNVVGGGLRLMPKNERDGWGSTLFKSKEDNEEFFEKYHKVKDAEVKNLYCHLMAIKIKRTEVQVPISTIQKDNIIEVYSSSDNLFLKELNDLKFESLKSTYAPKLNIVLKEGYEGEKLRFTNKYISCNEFFLIYKNYCVEGGYKPLSVNHFFKRIKENIYYTSLFAGKEIIYDKDDKKTKNVILFTKNAIDKDAVDENKTIIADAPLDATGEKSK